MIGVNQLSFNKISVPSCKSLHLNNAYNLPFSQNEWMVELETTKKEFEFRFIVDGARMLSKDYPTVELNQRGPLNVYQV